MIASKLVAAGAIVPTIYQPVPECFAVKWVPAVSEQNDRRASGAPWLLAQRFRSEKSLKFLKLLKPLTIKFLVKLFLEVSFKAILKRLFPL